MKHKKVIKRWDDLFRVDGSPHPFLAFDIPIGRRAGWVLYQLARSGRLKRDMPWEDDSGGLGLRHHIEIAPNGGKLTAL
jgi:hypothetical protein